VCRQAIDVRGYGATITGNNLHTGNPNDRLRLTISGGNTVVMGNVLENGVIEVDDATGKNKPIIVRDNVLENSIITHERGHLIPSVK